MKPGNTVTTSKKLDKNYATKWNLSTAPNKSAG